MKLTANTTSVTSVRGGESTEARAARMADFWSNGNGSRFAPLGQLFAKHPDAAITVIEGDSITVDEVTIQGIDFPVNPPMEINLRTVAAWGCPACHSAHGTGSGPSPIPNLKGLLSNQLYYSFVSQQIFALSRTCRDTYGFDQASKPFTVHAITNRSELVAIAEAGKPEPAGKFEPAKAIPTIVKASKPLKANGKSKTAIKADAKRKAQAFVTDMIQHHEAIGKITTDQAIAALADVDNASVLTDAELEELTAPTS